MSAPLFFLFFIFGNGIEYGTVYSIISYHQTYFATLTGNGSRPQAGGEEEEGGRLSSKFV